MNKGNKILLAILAFVVVCVVGYALFSENITVSGTATADGDWSITTTCSAGDTYNMFFTEFPSDKEGGYVDKKCSISNNKISIETELQYPTAMRVYTIEVKNTGSIDAVLKFDKPISEDAYPNAVNLLDASISLYNKETDALYKTYGLDQVEEFNNYGIIYIANAYIIIKKEDGSVIDSDEEFIANNRLYKDTEANNYLKIFPGESILIYFVASWPEDAEQTDYYGIATTEYEFKMQQFMDSFELETEETLCIGGC